ncbi:hypothetical protein CY34DRAFT_571177 [Suillus luteus UH-Slu-Lm8-n1]|uniref:Uncharacterized protein n=1 Tax=Suillus luteus UH-Slu-Lm8-n1 TaxID=930992 RepID=A0A0D0ABR0_9AGAM|nr:hypothetical protein CY34DRAFT_571177 [Suillus luteus UH-Slu-Lm8-n1]
MENMQSNNSSKGSSKASRSLRSLVRRNKKKDADSEDRTPLLSPEGKHVSPPESPVEFSPTDNGLYYIPNR